jgi:hypothetical protein
MGAQEELVATYLDRRDDPETSDANILMRGGTFFKLGLNTVLERLTEGATLKSLAQEAAELDKRIGGER